MAAKKKETSENGVRSDSERIGNEVASKNTQFIMSNRRAGYKTKKDMLKRSRNDFETSFNKVMAASVDLLADNLDTEEEEGRGLKIFNADYLEVNKMKREISSETMIERLITRKIQTASPFNTSLSSFQSQGQGQSLEFNVKFKGSPVSGIKVTANFSLIAYPSEGSAQNQETDREGKVLFHYDSSTWKPESATFNPKSDFWPQLTMHPLETREIELTELPKNGPLDWWQNSIGLYNYDVNAGKGIRIGVIDTGVGPHPFLSHVNSIGAFIKTKHLSDPKDGLDVSDHGTHVSGIIAARPTDTSKEYCGIVPGADVFVARVFPKGLNATQADIAYAIDTLAHQYGVHLINMSLGDSESSIIELDAIRYAMECGTLCVCAAGNNYGGTVSYPAAYPETVAVSGLGDLPNKYPPNSISAVFYPSQKDKYSSTTPLYLASYSNVGKEVVCCAPGTGIISTVPAYDDHEIPYLAMDGTSMASPMATATIASFLAELPQYQALPADETRFYFAANVVAPKCVSLNLSPTYQGYGLIHR